jgi:putative oxidoreductase
MTAEFLSVNGSGQNKSLPADRMRVGNGAAIAGIETGFWRRAMRIPFLIGRAMFGGYFIMSGINHFKQSKQMAQYAAAKKVPKPDVAVKATGAMMIVGGTSILLGIKPKLGTLAVIGFLAGVSPVMHDFWNEDAEQRMNDMINFTKNMALAGGAMSLMAVEEPWPASVPVFAPKKNIVQRVLREIAA